MSAPTDPSPSVVITTAGPRVLDPRAGHVLAHEHLLIDNRVWWEGPGGATVLDQGGPEDFARHLSEIRALPDGTRRENLVLSDWYLAAIELREAVRAGCRLVVDLTSEGLDPQPDLAARAAALAGVPLVLGLGRYVEASLDERSRRETRADLTGRWRQRLARGVDGHGTRYGVLGELGLSTVPTPVEWVTVAAAAQLSEEFDLPVAVHGALEPWDHRAIARMLRSAGLRPERTVIAHRDAVLDRDELLAWADQGFGIGLDLFGTGPHRSLHGRPFPSDDDRLAAVAALADRGLHERIVISHDLCTRDQLARYGGVGYAHIGLEVLPQLTALTSPKVAQMVGGGNALRWLHSPGSGSADHGVVLRGVDRGPRPGERGVRGR